MWEIKPTIRPEVELTVGGAPIEPRRNWGKVVRLPNVPDKNWNNFIFRGRESCGTFKSLRL